MATRLEKLRDAILAANPTSRLHPLTDADVAKLLAKYPKMPAHLRDVYSVIGWGGVGDSRYMIHKPRSPSGVFDAETAQSLATVVLVGDDFAGTFEAYDTAGRSWAFGTVDENGTFRRSIKPATFVDFLTDWFGSPVAG